MDDYKEKINVNDYEAQFAFMRNIFSKLSRGRSVTLNPNDLSIINAISASVLASKMLASKMLEYKSTEENEKV